MPQPQNPSAARLAQEVMGMLELRSSEGAEMEIRRMAIAVLRLLQREAPGFFSDFEIFQGEDRRETARISYNKV